MRVREELKLIRVYLVRQTMRGVGWLITHDQPDPMDDWKGMGFK